MARGRGTLTAPATLAFLAPLAPILWPAPASAALFQAAGVCASGLGNAFAGTAAVAKDACTVWYNPAGMTRLDEEELVLGLHLSSTGVEFEDTGSRVFFAAPLEGGSGGDAGGIEALPSFYYARPLGARLAFGLGLNRPFALDTEYRAGWVGRYHALRSEIGSVNLTATVGYRFSDHLSVGFGANLSRLDVELARAIDLGSMCFALELAGDLPFGDCDARGLEPQHSDGTVGFDADSTAVGFNLGLLWQPLERLRIGLAYRSRIAHDLGGRYSVSALDPRATAFAAGAAGVVDSAARGSLDLPDFESFSIFWRPVKRWELVGDWTRTGWSSLDELRIRLDSSVPDEVTTFEARDSVRASVGAIFAATERWRLRFGFAAEETAGSGARRQSARFPDAPRQWYALGFDFAVSERLDLSLGYAIVDADESGIEKLAFPRSEDFLRGSLRGTYGLGADVLSLQVRLRPR